MMKKLLLGTALFCTAVLLCAFDLVKEGKTVSVSLPENASEAEKFAKEELETFLAKISKVPVNGKLAGKILLGTPATRKDLPAKVKEKLEKSPNDAFYLCSPSADVLFIAGKDPKCVLYGVHALLEKLGVRFFYPGELGEEIPEKDFLSLPELDEFQAADFKYRTFNVCGTSSDFISTFVWMARNKMQVTGGRDWQLPKLRTKEAKQRFRDSLGVGESCGGHEWAMRAIPKSMFKDHPEYFVLKEGKRVCEGRVERCYSNSEVKRLAVEYYKKALRKNPSANIVIIAHDASDAFCQCEKCREMGTYQGKYSVSNLFHRFNKGVLDEVLKEFPDAVVNIFAYWNYRPAPEAPEVKYDYKNAVLLYASHQRCNAHAFTVKNVCNKSFVEEMLRWKDRCPAFGIYDYRYDAPNHYVPYEWVIAEDFPLFRKMNVIRWQDETVSFLGYSSKDPAGADKARSNWQGHYMSAKMLWNSSLDPVKLMEETYDIYYGKASPVMKKYHAYRKQLWDAAPGHSAIGGMDRAAYCLLTPGAEEKLQAYLDEALKTADTEKAKKRILQDRAFLEKYWKTGAEKLRKRLSSAKEILPEYNDGKIVIDGRHDEKVWLKARTLTDLVTREQKDAAEKTFLRVAYDKENLYIAVNAENKKAWSKVKAKAVKHDGAVWSDDSIELQIVPPDQEGKYYHLIVNTLGTVYDSKCFASTFDTKWDSQAEVKVLEKDKTWNYEIRIPFASLGSVPGALPWRLHLMRTVTNLQPPTTSEWTSIDGLRPYQPDSYRRMVFGKDLIRNGNFAVMGESKIDGKKVPFPQFWSLAGSKSYKIIPTATGNQVWTSGNFNCGFGVPKGLESGKNYHLVIRAKGPGTMSIGTWSWEGYQPRTNHRRLSSPRYKLTDKFEDYTFTFPCLPAESYVVLWIYGTKTIENVSCTIK